MEISLEELDMSNPQHIEKLVQVQKLMLQEQRELEKQRQDIHIATHELRQQAQEVEARKQAVELRKQDLETKKHESVSGLGTVLEKLSGQIGLQNVSETIRSYSGNPKFLKKWLAEIEKHVQLVTDTLDSTECQRIAYRTAKDVVSDFIGRFLQERPFATWDDLKENLQTRFGETVDSQTKLQKLRQFRQRYDQGVQLFAEVILGRAQEAYEGEDINNAFIQRELVSIFAKGLRSRKIAQLVLKRNPSTMDQAVKVASEATESEARLAAHGLRDEPMEVDEVKAHHKQSYKGGHKNFSGKPRVGPNKSKEQNHNKIQYKWEQGKPVCDYCKKIGHMYRECRSRQKAAADKRSNEKGLKEVTLVEGSD